MKVLAWPSKNDLNPYVELTYCQFKQPAATVSNFRYSDWLNSADIFHIHWPEAIFWGKSRLPFITTLRAFCVLIVAARVHANGGSVVLTLHNLYPHQGLSIWQSIVWKVYKRFLFGSIDLVVSLSTEALTLYRAVNPIMAGIPGVVVPHPHYRSYYACKPGLQESRNILGLPLNKKIVGLVGSLRPSKMIPEAIAAFLCASTDDEMLFVSGGCDDAYWSAIQQSAQGSDRITLRRGAMSEEQLAYSITACNVVLLNQPQMLNSGTALLALSFARPLISVAVGSLTELSSFVGTDWLKLFEKPLNAEKLRAVLDATWERPATGSPPIESLDPKILSDFLMDIFKNK